MARENAIFETSIDVERETVTTRVVATGKEYVLRLQDMHPNNRAYAALHGMKQRLVDNTAIERKDKDGRVRTPAEMAKLREEALAEMFAHYASGSPNWSVREPGKGRAPAIDLWEVVAAVETITGKPRETVLAMFDRRAAQASTTRQAIAESMARDARIAAELARRAAARADTSLTEGWEDELGDDTPEDTDTPADAVEDTPAE